MQHNKINKTKILLTLFFDENFKNNHFFQRQFNWNLTPKYHKTTNPHTAVLSTQPKRSRSYANWTPSSPWQDTRSLLGSVALQLPPLCFNVSAVLVYRRHPWTCLATAKFAAKEIAGDPRARIARWEELCGVLDKRLGCFWWCTRRDIGKLQEVRWRGYVISDEMICASSIQLPVNDRLLTVV